MKIYTIEQADKLINLEQRHAGLANVERGYNAQETSNAFSELIKHGEAMGLEQKEARRLIFALRMQFQKIGKMKALGKVYVTLDDDQNIYLSIKIEA